MSSAEVPLLSNRISGDIPAMKHMFDALLTGQTSSLTSLPTGSMRWVFNETKTQLTLQYSDESSWTTIGKLMHDVDTVDGYHAASGTTAGTIPVRNSSGAIEGNITGTANHATTATSLSATLAIAQGGTGATTAAQARINLGVPSLSNSITSTSSSTAASSYAVKLVNDKSTQAYNLANAANNRAIPSLSSSISSTSTTVAANSYAVNQVYNLANGKMTNFVMEDGDSTTVTITNGKYVKFVEGRNIDINFTDTSPGSSTDEYDLTFTVPDGTTSVKGCVKLNSSTSSTSQTEAATPYAVKLVSDRVTTAQNAANTASSAASAASSAANTAQSTASAAQSTANGKMTNFYAEDGDGTAVSVTSGKYLKFVEGGNVDINFTDTSTGSSTDEYDLTFQLTPVVNVTTGTTTNGYVSCNELILNGYSITVINS